MSFKVLTVTTKGTVLSLETVVYEPHVRHGSLLQASMVAERRQIMVVVYFKEEPPQVRTPSCTFLSVHCLVYPLFVVVATTRYSPPPCALSSLTLPSKRLTQWLLRWVGVCNSSNPFASQTAARVCRFR